LLDWGEEGFVNGVDRRYGREGGVCGRGGSGHVFEPKL
jgi:hypothetical protein